MKTLHVSLSVDDLDKSVAYYGQLFGRDPDVLKPDFAKWWLDDPKVNFALSHGQKPGLSHLGIQVEETDELAELYQRARCADGVFREDGDTVCCYARSTKGWSVDPQGIPWEVFLTSEHLHEESPREAEACPAGVGCC